MAVRKRPVRRALRPGLGIASMKPGAVESASACRRLGPGRGIACVWMARRAWWRRIVEIEPASSQLEPAPSLERMPAHVQVKRVLLYFVTVTLLRNDAPYAAFVSTPMRSLLECTSYMHELFPSIAPNSCECGPRNLERWGCIVGRSALRANCGAVRRHDCAAFGSRRACETPSGVDAKRSVPIRITLRKDG